MEFDMYKETSIDHGSSSDTVPRAEGSLEGPNLFLRKKASFSYTSMKWLSKQIYFSKMNYTIETEFSYKTKV
jgi:hypothetical protein